MKGSWARLPSASFRYTLSRWSPTCSLSSLIARLRSSTWYLAPVLFLNVTLMHISSKRKDNTSIFYAARALMGIQRRHGLFPRIIGKGNRARMLADQLIRMRSEEDVADGSSPFALTPSSVLGELIIIDRDVDFVTPLMTQLTYEGLIDETIGIQHCKSRSAKLVSLLLIGQPKSSLTLHVRLLLARPRPDNTPAPGTPRRRFGRRGGPPQAAAAVAATPPSK